MKDAIIQELVMHIDLLEEALANAPIDYTSRQDALEDALYDILQDVPDDDID